jgi:hypothetical protein
VLARLSRVIADPAILGALRELTDPQRVHDLIAEAEAELDD